MFAVGLHLLTSNDEGTPVGDPLGDEIAELPKEPDGVRPGPVQPTPEGIARGPEQNAVIAEPLTQLAVAAVDKVTSAAKRLRDRRDVILQPVRSRKVPRIVWTQVENDVQAISGGLFILERLQNEDLVQFESGTNACVIHARTTLNFYERAASRRNDLSLVVRSLSSCSLDGLSNLQITRRIQQIRHPNLLLDILAEPKIQNIVKKLQLSSCPGWCFIPFGGGDGHPQFHGSWSMVRLQAIRLPQPAQKQPEQQPAGKKLRKRSRR